MPRTTPKKETLREFERKEKIRPQVNPQNDTTTVAKTPNARQVVKAYPKRSIRKN